MVRAARSAGCPGRRLVHRRDRRPAARRHHARRRGRGRSTPPPPPDWFGVNCAHPTHLAPPSTGATGSSGSSGVRPNASTMTHAELDVDGGARRGRPGLLTAVARRAPAARCRAWRSSAAAAAPTPATSPRSGACEPHPGPRVPAPCTVGSRTCLRNCRDRADPGPHRRRRARARRARAAADGRSVLDGFLDAGNAAARAAQHLVDLADSRVVATFDVDQLHDYRARRPPMSFVRDHYASYEPPRLVVRLCHDTGGTPYLLLHGPEPDIRWEAFCRGVPDRRGAVRRPPRRLAGIGADGGAAHPADRDHPARQRPRPADAGRAGGAASCGSRPAPRPCSRCGWGSGATTRWASSRTSRTTSPSSTTRLRRSRCSSTSSGPRG